MIVRLRKIFHLMADAFWVLPSVLVLALFFAALVIVEIERSNSIPEGVIYGPWLYSGSATGARTLLGAIASSTIGVAGTVFSVTIAALSLAAGQMGPRLLRNFVRDRGNQTVLGILLGTFSYALVVLRNVRVTEEGEFVPHLAISVAIALSLVCVGMIVYFVGHMAVRINVDTVIELVSGEVRLAIKRLTVVQRQPEPPAAAYWRGAAPIRDKRHGYLQHLDESGLAAWAANRHVAIRMLIRPGQYVFPGAIIAEIQPATEGADAAVRDASALGSTRASSSDLEYEIRQLVEVALRALSPGINDPLTAISVLDRLGEALCEIAPLHLQSGVHRQEDKVLLVIPPVTYDGLLDAMFNMIRQSAAGNPAVLIHMMDILTTVSGCERDTARLRGIARHADMILSDGERTIGNGQDLADLVQRHRAFERARSTAATDYPA